jgi:hypothetical protein
MNAHLPIELSWVCRQARSNGLALAPHPIQWAGASQFHSTCDKVPIYVQRTIYIKFFETFFEIIVIVLQFTM